ncbi:MAG: universal stress protein [Pseudomonadales bacterium]|jgi:nucleotide-binding universal stress UspA family protein|nr:universal stress protein [Pseudomonadales bacterium]
MNILAAIDFSSVTPCMLDALVRLPLAKDAHVYLVHAAEPDPDFVGWDAGPDTVRDQVAAMFHREHRELEGHAESLRDKGLTVTALLIQGATVDVILKEADKLDADMIVVGTHGHGAAYDLIVGSISSGIIRKSKVPVLVVPCPKRD